MNPAAVIYHKTPLWLRFTYRKSLNVKGPNLLHFVLKRNLAQFLI